MEVTVEATKEVTDAEVDERIERERNNLAELVLKEGPAADGDTVVIDFVGSVDGVEFDGGKGDNFSLGLGSGQFIQDLKSSWLATVQVKQWTLS